MKVLLHVYLIAVPAVVLVAKDVWPAFWPDAWLLITAGVIHGALVTHYGLLKWPAELAETALGCRETGIPQAFLESGSSGRALAD